MNLRDFLREFFTLDPRRIDPWRTAALVLLVLLVAAGVRLKLMPEIREVQSTIFKRVPQIREVAKVQRVLVPCPERGIVALDRDQVTRQLGPGWMTAAPLTHPSIAEEVPAPHQGGTRSLVAAVDSTSPPLRRGDRGDLPSSDQAASDLHPLATAEVRESTRATDVVAVYNSTTGQTDLVAKERPAPWLQLRNDYVLGLRYGIDHRLDQTATIYGSWTVLRFKDLYLSGYTELASDPQRIGDDLRWKGQLDLQYRH